MKPFGAAVDQWLEKISKTKSSRLALLALVLLVSLPSIKLIPFYSGHNYPFAVDFHNLHAFHNCEVKNDPYLVPGSQCGDGNNQVYPPLMYWSYAWVRGMDYYPTGVFVWVAAVLLMMTFAAWFWTRREPKTLWLWPLFVLQFPMFFALERANNDAMIVLVWSVATWLFTKRNFVWAGAFCGIAIALKIYPILATGLIGLGFVLRIREEVPRQMLIEFSFGVVLGLLLNFAIFPMQSWVYFTQVLPGWSLHGQGMDISVHSVFSIFRPLNIIVGLMFGSVLGLTWALGLREFVLKDVSLAFAGALCVSTFFVRTSNDYNLVTAYPLFLLLAARFVKTGERAQFYLFLAGALTVLGYRFLWENSVWNVAGPHIALQVFWMVGLVYWYRSRGPRENLAH